MPSKHRRLVWIALFICGVLLLGTLATGWNLVLVNDYRRMVELAHALENSNETHPPWTSVVLGTLGFVAALGALVLFFVRLLKEMHLNQMQSEFLASVTHELKTPIAALELTSTLIENGDLTSDEEGDLWKSHRLELKRLNDEVSTLLEAARWQSKGPQFNYSSIQLEQWLLEAMKRWGKILGSQSKIERLGDPLITEIETDPRAFAMITDNIIDNARKFSKDTPRIRIRTELIDNRWKIEFSDEGWGFEPQDSRKIFDRFVRAKSGAPQAVSGTGLGLYIAKSSCKRLGLTLKASSDGLGKGATFILEGRS